MDTGISVAGPAWEAFVTATAHYEELEPALAALLRRGQRSPPIGIVVRPHEPASTTTFSQKK